MAEDNKILLEAFNVQFADFIKDIEIVFPHEEDIHRAKTYILSIKRLDPKLLITIWKHYIINKPEYKQAIMAGNIDFFIEKDYNEDLKHLKSADKVASAIDGMRTKIKQMGANDRETAIQYMQNLSILSENYKG